VRLFDARDRPCFLPVTAIAEGHEPPFAHREHGVVVIAVLGDEVAATLGAFFRRALAWFAQRTSTSKRSWPTAI